jgi:GNAT superfamily N-acetyltransferase
LGPPEPLEGRHDSSDFDCGEPALNRWLREHALQSHRSGFSKTYVIHERNRILGFYTLAAGSVMLEEAPGRVRSGSGRHRIPVAILARLAVDNSVGNRGLGSGLVRDALYRIAAAGDIIGVRAVLVHVKRSELRHFYGRFGFEPSPVDDSQMFLLMKDLRHNLG